MAGRSYTSITDPRYKYTEKERDVETGYDYFGARYYDARIGRWLAVDPLAEKYPAWSAYVYGADCPVFMIDPNGMEWRVSGDMQVVRKDIQDLVGAKNMQHVSIDNGRVLLSQGFEATPGSGAELVQQLVDDKDHQFEYTVANSIDVELPSGSIRNINVQGVSVGLVNLVAGGLLNDQGSRTLQPVSAEGQVVVPAQHLAEVNGQQVPRTNVVFHELKENQLMVLDPALPRRTTGSTDAHRQAGAAGQARAKLDNIDPAGSDGNVDIIIRKRPYGFIARHVARHVNARCAYSASIILD
jgi:RHS repeat-associated protein